jgi:Tol biopolymer transport system component
MPDVVIVDASDGSVRTTIADARARIVTPAWSADGGVVVAAADFDGEPFDLYQFPLSPLRVHRGQADTHQRRALADVSSDGQTIVFAGYGVDGYDLYSHPGRRSR